MNIIKKNDILNPEESLCIRSGITDYLGNFTFISKMDNPKVILEYIKLIKEQTGVLLTFNDIPDAPEDAYKPSRKGK